MTVGVCAALALSHQRDWVSATRFIHALPIRPQAQGRCCSGMSL